MTRSLPKNMRHGLARLFNKPNQRGINPPVTWVTESPLILWSASWGNHRKVGLFGGAGYGKWVTRGPRGFR